MRPARANDTISSVNNVDSNPREADPRSILVVLPTWVGDFVMATPVLRAIRDCYPTAHIMFLMEPNLRELVRGGDWMNECVEWPAKERRKPWNKELRAVAGRLRARRPDWAILLPNSARSAMIAFLARAKRRIGYDRDGRGFLLTDRLPVKNRVDRKFVQIPIIRKIEYISLDLMIIVYQWVFPEQEYPSISGYY